MSKVVIFGYGNPSRGDDAIGPVMLQKVEHWLGYSMRNDIELVADFQLQVEHALDLDGRDLALFLDARASGADPYRMEEIAPQDETGYTSHSLPPQAVLAVYRKIRGKSPPKSYLLSVRGENFELGQPLSENAARNCAAAWEFLRKFLEEEKHGADPTPRLLD